MTPPQPLHMLNVAATRTASTCRARLFFHPKQQNATASTEPGNHGVELRCKDAVVVEVVTVSVVVATAPAGVTAAGAKLHDAPAGKFVQLNETGEENEFSGVTWTDTAPLCPAVTLSAVGETVRLKPGVAVVRSMV